MIRLQRNWSSDRICDETPNWPLTGEYTSRATREKRPSHSRTLESGFASVWGGLVLFCFLCVFVVVLVVLALVFFFFFKPRECLPRNGVHEACLLPSGQPHRWATRASSHPALPLSVLDSLSPGLLPCQRPLGAVILWAITAEHCLCCRDSWLAPGELGLSRCYTSLPTIASEQGERVSYWTDQCQPAGRQEA